MQRYIITKHELVLFFVHRCVQTGFELSPDYFDFRLHYDRKDQVDCVTWKVGPCRGAFEIYGSKIFLDFRKRKL